MDNKRLLELAGILKESTDYVDSADFTEDYLNLLDSVHNIFETVNSKRWNNWMKVTEQNYDVKTVKASDDLKTIAKALKKAAAVLESQMNKA